MRQESKWFESVPEGMWVKCPKCGEILYQKDWLSALKVCKKCGHHFRMTALERVEHLLDPGSFEEVDGKVVSSDPLNFPEYVAKLKRDRIASSLNEAVYSGRGTLEQMPLYVAITDARFLMGSMGSAVGEKVTRAIERATEERLPILTICGTGGGARMQEGILSLMQMPKTCAALARHHAKKLLHISLLTDPSMAGVMASWASVGDIILAEPGAMVGFAGLRVARQVQKGKFPENFQTSEYQFERGMIDLIVPRKELRDTLAKILYYTGSRPEKARIDEAHPAEEGHV
jgi:acetyl-CoA carboxylase carboxyl transferase subunit beta